MARRCSRLLATALFVALLLLFLGSQALSLPRSDAQLRLQSLSDRDQGGPRNASPNERRKEREREQTDVGKASSRVTWQTSKANQVQRRRDKKKRPPQQGSWHDLPYGKFRAAGHRGNGTTSDLKPQGDATGLAPAEAPGVTNAIGKGFDPQFIIVPLQNGSQLYVTPEVNFARGAFLRASVDLNDIYRNQGKMHQIFNYSASAYPEGVGTEAGDIVRWDGGKFLVTVSALADYSMRALLSKGQDILGDYEDWGRIMHNGSPLQGYDSHVIAHPNGQKYLTWSNNQGVRLVQLSGPNTAVGPIVDLVSYGVDTEAPTLWIFPNLRTGSQTLNLAYAEGHYYESNYNTRVLFIDVAEDPLDVTKWYQRGAPTLSSDSSQGVYGPGSGSFFTGPDGRTWFSYGAFDTPKGADNGKNDRFVRVQVAKPDDRGVWVPTQVIATPKTY